MWLHAYCIAVLYATAVYFLPTISAAYITFSPTKYKFTCLFACTCYFYEMCSHYVAQT